MTRIEAAPLDLEMRIRALPEDGRTRLMFTLHSPNGKAPFFQREIAGPTFPGRPEDYHSHLLKKLENLGERRDIDDSPLLRDEIKRKLEGLGHQLWRELFPPELQQAYRDIRQLVSTWLIVSDEPWIPWELVKPFDASRRDDVINDDFLSLGFELTRWLAGVQPPAAGIGIRRFVTISTDPSLPQAGSEESALQEIVTACPGVAFIPFAPSSSEELLGHLETGGAGALHFLGHGSFPSGQADEAGIPLPDGGSFRAEDLEGSLAARIGEDRPLVFLNACWAGQQGWSITRLGGWAARWVGVSGSGAFVAPLWLTRDKAALELARTFYSALINGAPLGQAALEARRHLRATRPGDPSALAYVVYGHPNARILFGDSNPDPGLIPARVPAAIREKIRSFDLLIRRKTEGFVGRQWLFDAIDSFVNSRRQGYVQILGDPGIGKTTLVAEMVRRHRHPHHFNIRAEGIQKPEQFLPNLCAQLIARFGLPYSHLPPETTRDASFLVNLLDKASAQLKPSGKKLLVLVDALDESDPTSVTRGSNTLYLPVDLPDDVFFVVTSRRGGPPLRYACDDHKIDLHTEAENNFADVRMFAQSWLGREGIQSYVHHQGLDETAFVDEIVRLSEGNFMYLHYILPEIERGTYRDRTFNTLPSGLLNYYEDQWNRMKDGDPDAWFDYKIPVLKALTIAKEPISLGLIADFSEVRNPARIHAVLQEWAGFLQPIEVQEDGERETRWRLYHESFFDFIAAREDLRDAHKKAADALWRELYPEE